MMTTPTPAETRPAKRWPFWLFRIAITIAAILMFDQAIFAGQFLSGNYPALLSHRNGSSAAVGAVVACIVTAAIQRRVGKGPLWPLFASIGLFLIAGIQTSLGYQLVLAVHIPLGVTLIMLVTALAVWAWWKK
jgi:hypothetical protein